MSPEASQRFRYRYVPFGTRFQVTEGEYRDQSPQQGGPAHERLFANEIAVDVGGACWTDGAGSQGLMVFDHHFQRHNQFPSAAAAVLHHAADIAAWGGGRPVTGGPAAPPLWLVTHTAPDFDAWCALYLVRRILVGGIPAGGWDRCGIKTREWEQVDGRRIDWFEPAIDGAAVGSYSEPDRKPYAWPILLAAYASRVDHCRPMLVPRPRALHSVLYAGVQRGRPWGANGAAPFFDEVVDAIVVRELNPLFDDLFAGQAAFAAECALLDEEETRYQRDLRKGRMSMVTVQVAPFERWFPDAAAQPIRAGAVQTAPVDARSDGPAAPPSAHQVRQCDGIYVRDPECLLFKEWARHDTANSPLGAGFLFTAVAYSRGRPQSTSGNTSDYFFSLDPERGENAHLYNVWSQLQGAELAARPEVDRTVSRRGFEGRQTGLDPWFDGHNFRATIVATPNSGTAIETETKVAADLSDDRVAAIVAAELEYGCFGEQQPTGGGTPATVANFATLLSAGQAATARDDEERVPIARAIQHSLKAETLRFVSVPILDTNLSTLPVAAAIGRKMWPFLEPQGIATVPTDFLERHLIVHPNYVAVWNRNGVAVAYTRQGAAVADRVRQNVKRLAAVLLGVRSRSSAQVIDERMDKGIELKEDIVTLSLEAASPSMIPIRRLLESRRFEAILSSAQSLDTERFQAAERRNEREQKRRDDRLQVALAVVAVFGLVFSWNQVEALSVENLASSAGGLYRLGLGVLLALAAVIVPQVLLRARGR